MGNLIEDQSLTVTLRRRHGEALALVQLGSLKDFKFRQRLNHAYRVVISKDTKIPYKAEQSPSGGFMDESLKGWMLDAPGGANCAQEQWQWGWLPHCEVCLAEERVVTEFLEDKQHKLVWKFPDWCTEGFYRRLSIWIYYATPIDVVLAVDVYGGGALALVGDDDAGFEDVEGFSSGGRAEEGVNSDKKTSESPVPMQNPVFFLSLSGAVTHSAASLRKLKRQGCMRYWTCRADATRVYDNVTLVSNTCRPTASVRSGYRTRRGIGLCVVRVTGSKHRVNSKVREGSEGAGGGDFGRYGGGIMQDVVSGEEVTREERDIDKQLSVLKDIKGGRVQTSRWMQRGYVRGLPREFDAGIHAWFFEILKARTGTTRTVVYEGSLGSCVPLDFLGDHNTGLSKNHNSIAFDRDKTK
ncbi:hypothetical protein BDP27DRAFT_1407593 [Rhodocollybia butyracea]|uniref:Uncharacterized protein n=1 Tax=Rhodocollybia butyracea TaxID=206335 RepID=A0A9P5P9V0_9AGAR|nr:hypothetical protein BDP27DRAFT_1407593 [Rhodocollybia butyracea]